MAVAGNECVTPFHNSVQEGQSVEPDNQMEWRYATIYLVHRIGPNVDILTVNYQPQARVEIGIGQKRETLLHLCTLPRQVLELSPAVKSFDPAHTPQTKTALAVVDNYLFSHQLPMFLTGRPGMVPAIWKLRVEQGKYLIAQGQHSSLSIESGDFQASAASSGLPRL